MEPIVIIGAGMAAYGLARELRKRDGVTPLLIVTRDAGRAYAKPMLSNAIAQGKEAAALAAQDATQMGEQLKAHVQTHTTVLRIDTAARVIETDKGRITYARLVLALGAAPIRLPLEGDAADQVLSVNHLDDYARLRAQLAALGRPAQIAILGAGLIGCEFADDLAGGGHHVTLVDPNPRLLSALASPGLSQGLAQAWQSKPVTLKLGTVARAVQRRAHALAVSLADGSALDADIVLSAVGLRPHIALAQQAGIATGRGILVDEHGRTSAPDVYALGDCAEYRIGASTAVMPYVAPMLAAARAIAATLAGTPTPLGVAPEAVIVKTPSYKLALLPPPAGLAGAWHEQDTDQRRLARFIDAAGTVRGFGVSHHTPALRQSLQAELGSVPAL